MTQAAKEVVDFSDPGLPVKAYITNYCGTVNYHLHNEIEWLYAVTGNMTIFVMDETIILHPGEIIIINSYVVHSTMNDSVENNVCLVQFNPDVLIHNTLISEYKYAIPFMCQDRFRYLVIQSEADEQKHELAKLLLETASEFLKKPIGYEIMIKSNLYKLLALLYRYRLVDYQQPEETGRRIQIKAKMTKVINYIEQHFDESIEVSQMAELVSLNTDYFSRVFKSVTGQSFIQYLNTVRISIAEKLLLSTDRQITDILVETGFSSLSYFNRTFKKLKQCCPSDYRKQAIPFPNAKDDTRFAG